MPGRSKRGILERLKTDVVVGAEGYVFELERRGYIKAGPYVPEVVLDFPDALRDPVPTSWWRSPTMPIARN